MDFYFPVPAETYSSFTIELYNGADAIDGTQRTLANTSMLLETGKIYRTPTITLGPKKILVAYCNKQTFFVLFFVKLFVHFARQFRGSFVPVYC